MEKTPLNRQQMAARLAQEFEEGWIVNLGIGIPTLCSNYADDVILHAENGVIGYGALLPKGEEDLHLVNAGRQHVSLKPGPAIVPHADSCALVRGGPSFVCTGGGGLVAGPRGITTVAPWGLRAMTGLLLCAGTVVCTRRLRRIAADPTTGR